MTINEFHNNIQNLYVENGRIHRPKEIVDLIPDKNGVYILPGSENDQTEIETKEIEGLK